MSSQLTQNMYFCWKCKKDVTCSLPDLNCDECGSDFVEETQDEERYPSSSGILSNFFNLSGEQRVQDNQRVGNVLNSLFGALGRGNNQQGGGNSNSFATVLETLFQTISEGDGAIIEGVGPNGFRIRSGINMGGGGGRGRFNLGDFFGGRIDDIVTRLMNEHQPVGDPPAEEEDIENLELVTCNQEFVDRKEKCPVCMEEFKLDESGVVKLPCNHTFHHVCVAQWLRMHDSCPVCRIGISTREENSNNLNTQSGNNNNLGNNRN